MPESPPFEGFGRLSMSPSEEIARDTARRSTSCQAILHPETRDLSFCSGGSSTTTNLRGAAKELVLLSLAPAGERVAAGNVVGGSSHGSRKMDRWRWRLKVGETLFIERRLGAESREGEHGEAAVSDLLDEHVVVGHLEGIEGEVARGTARAVGGLVESDAVHQFEGADDEEHEAHVALGDHGVVRRERREALVLGRREVEAEVDGDPTNDGHHADATVLELGFAHPVDHGKAVARPAKRLLGHDRLAHVPVELGEAHRIEADVPGVSPIEGLRNLEERHRRGLGVDRRGAGAGRGGRLEGRDSRREAEGKSNLHRCA
mmetsp:Transcript_4415/g.11312  ORF Transcript_4415/g.11312 Transcript_4415/m.11312 type:complete len:318 (+) Transcript_4415:223-1176(+)